MKKLLLLVLIIILNISFTSCSIENDDLQVPDLYHSENIKVVYSEIDYEIAELINAYRASKELLPLNILNQASKEAITHNVYMVEQGEASHDFFYLRSENLKNEVNAKRVSENVGYGYSSAQAIVNAWLKSDEHRKNIENPEFTDIGISTKKDENGRNYFTNIFVNR
ncbi:CAP domain-containing protein [Flaviramulus sp. BrNp1-15]|uniref:CAP domain-containing protein n=1 Tax=Flaviramulus sp. BrNp1-15 TaxID=2916754 RepID=UPI001EE7D01F|nr:CAP domain-containing protein [Flaviramulus sp. BrNp1-15]ULC60352.1 CAP domain-containing protein [Flaviramulus sp. BrNp1-15]